MVAKNKVSDRKTIYDSCYIIFNILFIDFTQLLK